MAGVLRLAMDIVARVDEATTPAAAGRAFFDALKDMGVRGFGARAYDAAGGSSSTSVAPGILAQVLPSTWRGSMSARFVEALDPLPKAARRLGRAAFLWSDPSPREARAWGEYWEALDEHGIGEGIAVHVFGPGGITSRVSVGFEERTIAHVERRAVEIASYALIDRMLAFFPDRKSAALTLSARERDCMALAAQGKSDSDIAAQLGIAESTAHFYIEKAKQRLGARTRAQAVAKLIAAGLL